MIEAIGHLALHVFSVTGHDHLAFHDYGVIAIAWALLYAYDDRCHIGRLALHVFNSIGAAPMIYSFMHAVASSTLLCILLLSSDWIKVSSYKVYSVHCTSI